LAAAIRNAFNIEPELIKSGGGAFEVRVDGDLIYSKLAKGVFPSDEEILADLKTRGA
jgi:selT/selW/selH-like putative selenoprotein